MTNPTPEAAGLIERLRSMYSHRGDGIPTQFVNPDGDEAATTIERLTAALESASPPMVPRGWKLVPNYVVAEAQFLCDRLDELDWSIAMVEFANLHSAHVDPSHSRLKSALEDISASPTAPAAMVPDREAIARAVCIATGDDFEIKVEKVF